MVIMLDKHDQVNMRARQCVRQNVAPVVHYQYISLVSYGYRNSCPPTNRQGIHERIIVI